MGKILYPGYFPNECGPYDYGYRWIESSLVGYMRMIWKVRKWRIELQYENTIYGSGLDAFYYISDAGSEEELVCGTGFHFVENESGRNWDISQFNILPIFNSPNDYRPYWSLTFRISGDAGDYGVGIGECAGLPDELNRNVYQVTLLNFGNINATLYCCSPYDDIHNTITTVTQISAMEYWSYDGTYSMETGDRF